MRRAVVALVVVAVGVLAVAFGVRLVAGSNGGNRAAAGCTFGNFLTTTSQAQIAATMAGVALQRGLPERATVLTIAAALQESKLRNIPAGQGDLDSVGVLQQRPSQGWGTPAQLADISYATGKFLDALVKVPNWQTDPLADVIQEVQVSADGNAYAKHESKAQAISDALYGTTPEGIRCQFDEPDVVSTPASLAARVSSELPINTPTLGANDVTVPGAGWATAAWFVANADQAGVDSVSYNGRKWTRADGKWTKDDAASDAAVVARLHST